MSLTPPGYGHTAFSTGRVGPTFYKMSAVSFPEGLFSDDELAAFDTAMTQLRLGRPDDCPADELSAQTTDGDVRTLLESLDRVPLLRGKVFFVGRGRAGKTTTLKCLKKMLFDQHESSTIAAQCDTLSNVLNREDIQEWAPYQRQTNLMQHALAVECCKCIRGDISKGDLLARNQGLPPALLRFVESQRERELNVPGEHVDQHDDAGFVLDEDEASDSDAAFGHDVDTNVDVNTNPNANADTTAKDFAEATTTVEDDGEHLVSLEDVLMGEVLSQEEMDAAQSLEELLKLIKTNPTRLKVFSVW